MKKIHTRIKRKLNLSTHFGHYYALHPKLDKANRPKTFKTEEGAHNWADKMGIAKDNYVLEKVKKNKKFQVVMLDGKNKINSDKKDNA